MTTTPRTTAPRIPAPSPPDLQPSPSEGLRVLARMIARAYLRDTQPPPPIQADSPRGAV